MKMGDQNRETVAIDVLKDIALVMDGMIFERQRAIDALTLFHRKALPALEEIVRKVDSGLLKERAALYVQRIKEGIDVNVSL